VISRLTRSWIDAELFDFTQGHRAKRLFLDANTGLETTGESDE